MSELSLHNIKKIDIRQDFIEENKPGEFSTIYIDVESTDEHRVKTFQICFFIDHDTELNIKNLFLVHNRGRVNPAPKSSNEEKPEGPESDLDPF